MFSGAISGQRQVCHELAQDIRAKLWRRTGRQLRLGSCFCHDSNAPHAPWLAILVLRGKRAWRERVRAVVPGELRRSFPTDWRAASSPGFVKAVRNTEHGAC